LNNKKILFVVSEDWYFLSHRLPLARALLKAGFEVCVACHVQQGRDKIEAENIRVIPLHLDRESLSPSVALKTVQNLTQIYKIEKPDVIIHVSMLLVLLGSLAALRAKSHKIVNLVTGLGFLFISRSLKARLFRPIIKIAFSYFARLGYVHMVVQNQDDQSLFNKLGFKTNHNLSLIRGSGVDADSFTPADQPPKEVQITFVGRLLWAKGVAEIIDAARILKQQGRLPKIILVGEPDPGNPQSASEVDVKAWVDEGLVECWGRRADINDIYRQSTIALLPSWREGLPKSLLEAAACGLPMIATDVPGCREIVKHEENGLLVPLKAPSAIADAILHLLDQPEIAEHYGQNARRFVEGELNDTVIAKKTMSLIQHIADI